MLSWPGLTSSPNPPGMYLEGLRWQFMKYMQTEVKRVDAKNRAKPRQFVRPSIPATAPEKQAARNLTVVSEELCWTFGANMSWAAASGVDIGHGLGLFGKVQQRAQDQNQTWQEIYFMHGFLPPPTRIPI
jgi:hypothetical protein